MKSTWLLLASDWLQSQIQIEMSSARPSIIVSNTVPT